MQVDIDLNRIPPEYHDMIVAEVYNLMMRVSELYEKFQSSNQKVKNNE